MEALDRGRFEPVLIGIDRSGRWHLVDQKRFLVESDNQNIIEDASVGACVAHLPIPGDRRLPESFASITEKGSPAQLDVCFPVLHGTYGEDGTIQGFLKLAGIPFVGASVLGSCVGMDKDVMKRLLQQAGIPVAKFLVFGRHEISTITFETVAASLGKVCFVKPANLGSSVGISKADSAEKLAKSVAEAFNYDNKIIIEEAVNAREIECAVMGNENPKVAVPGEVATQSSHDFYDYDAKYISAQGAKTIIPADLSPEMVRKAQETAAGAYKALCCEGLGRVDLFLKSDGAVLVNEINTLPGFTNISMYPKMWEASGVSYRDLISQLIDLGLARFQSEARLQTGV